MREPDGPADTRMMAIVHGALRRDLAETRGVLTTPPAPQGRQRRALGAHVVWMMEFLHHHHTAEDDGLWPLVRRRNPSAGALLDSLDADHRRIAPALEALTAAAHEYTATATDHPRVALIEALDALTDVLLPHLDREVDEAMPVVAASITQREWRGWDQTHNVKPKSMRQLGFEGHFLLDGIDADGYDLVVHQVPPIPRFVLLHGFARSYRRQADLRWRPQVPARQLAAG